MILKLNLPITYFQGIYFQPSDVIRLPVFLITKSWSMLDLLLSLPLAQRTVALLPLWFIVLWSRLDILLWDRTRRPLLGGKGKRLCGGAVLCEIRSGEGDRGGGEAVLNISSLFALLVLIKM